MEWEAEWRSEKTKGNLGKTTFVSFKTCMCKGYREEVVEDMLPTFSSTGFVSVCLCTCHKERHWRIECFFLLYSTRNWKNQAIHFFSFPIISSPRFFSPLSLLYFCFFFWWPNPLCGFFFSPALITGLCFNKRVGRREEKFWFNRFFFGAG